jgi:hypothetical protein
LNQTSDFGRLEPEVRHQRSAFESDVGLRTSDIGKAEECLAASMHLTITSKLRWLKVIYLMSGAKLGAGQAALLDPALTYLF